MTIQDVYSVPYFEYNKGLRVGGPFDGSETSVQFFPSHYPKGHELSREELEVDRVFSKKFPEAGITRRGRKTFGNLWRQAESPSLIGNFCRSPIIARMPVAITTDVQKFPIFALLSQIYVSYLTLDGVDCQCRWGRRGWRLGTDAGNEYSPLLGARLSQRKLGSRVFFGHIRSFDIFSVSS